MTGMKIAPRYDGARVTLYGFGGETYSNLCETGGMGEPVRTDPPSADDLSSLHSRVGTGCYRSTSRRPAGAGTFDVRGGSPSGSLTLCGDQMLGPFEASQ